MAMEYRVQALTKRISVLQDPEVFWLALWHWCKF